MALFTEDSDEDSIATDTSAESEHSEDHRYSVEAILAEARDKYNRRMYLVKWEGYALHRATWEPRSCFDTDDEINQWKAKKRAAEAGGPCLFDVLEYEEALEVAEEEKESKARRRRAKRKRREGLESRTRTPLEATAASPVTSRRISQASPAKKKGVAQKVVKTPKAAKSTAKSLNSASTTTAKPTTTIGLATTTKPAVAAEPVATETPATTTNPSTAAKPDTTVKLGITAEPTKAKPAESTIKPPQPARKTATSRPLIGPDVPELKRKQKARISENTPKDSTAPKFRTLSEQNRHQKYSRNEPAPNINAVPLLDLNTGKPLPDDLQPASAGKDNAPPISAFESGSTEKPYRRRSFPQSKQDPSADTPGQAEDAPSKTVQSQLSDQNRSVTEGRRKSVSQPAEIKIPASPPTKPKMTVPPSTTSTAHIADTHSAYWRITAPLEKPQRKPSPPTVQQETRVRDEASTALPLDHPKRMACKYFQTGTCRFTAGTCRFAHSYVGAQESAKKYTCYYWSLGGGCFKSADQCEFSHYDTGLFAPGPSSQTCFYWRSYGKCNKTQGQCKFAHYETGIPAPAPPGHVDRGSKNGPVVGIAAVPLPESAGSRPAETASSHASHQSFSAPHQGFFASPVETDVAMQLDMSYLSVTARSPDIHMQEGRSIREDLDLARRSVRGLDASTLLSKNGKQIENVYILMPSEREEERKLLIDYFRGFHCKVFDSSHPQHWDFFKSLGSSLLVVHTEETFAGTLPGLAKYLQHNKGWVFSIGVHEDWHDCDQGHPKRKYEARRVFPHGGITFISDDVFEYYPEKATEIIQEFHVKAKKKPSGSETSKIGARPGVQDWLARLAQKKMEEVGEDYEDDRYVKCWDAICDLCPLEDYDPYEMELGNMIPKDDALLWSVAEQDLPSFQGLWEKDEAKATDMMANFFAGTGVERMADFQRYCFIHQRSDQMSMNEEVTASQLPAQVVMDKPDPKGWMARYNHIEVMTPDAWLAMTRKRTQQQEQAIA